VRLHLDGKCLIDSWCRAPERPLSATVALAAGRACGIRLEYAQLSRKGRVQLGWIAPGGNDALDRALAAARAAARVILTLGLTPDLEGESMTVTAEGFDGGDRLTLALPQTQRTLLEKVCALGKPTVLVLTGGAAITFDHAKPNAVLLAWYYGQRGADAVADALLGETNPAGRLPVTFYQDDSQLPPFDDYAMAGRTYRYFGGRPLYAFGHGLSYTTFAYDSLKLTPETAPPGGAITAGVTIKNTGPRDGDEVVQLYATAVAPPVPMPLRQLVGFKRVPLKAGETRSIEIPVPLARLRRWSPGEKRYIIDPGAWQFTAGPASDQPLLTARLTIK
jgi:beta-glucosidase